MTRYYFHIRNGNSLAVDEEGMDLPSFEAALEEAETSGRELLADMVRDGAPLDGQAVEIATADGTVLRRVPLKALFWVGA